MRVSAGPDPARTVMNYEEDSLCQDTVYLGE